MRLLNDIRNYMGSYRVKSGVYHYYRNEYRQAIDFLRKALGEDEQLDDGDRTIARTYLTLALKGRSQRLAADQKLDEALETLDEALEINESYPDLHLLTAQIAETQSRGEAAIAAYRRAIELHPDYLDARVGLAYCLANRGRASDAAAEFERAWTIKLARLEQPFREGLLQLRGDDPGAGRQAMDTVFVAAPEVAADHQRQALEACRAESWDAVLEHVAQALRLNPGYPDLHNLRGVALYEGGQFDEAAEAFRTSIELCPEHLVPQQNLAFALAGAGAIQEASEMLEAILEREPANPVAASKLVELRTERESDRRPPAKGAPR